jgi:hypothetical protein
VDVVLVVALVLAVGVLVALFSASRLDHMHGRLDTMRTSIDAQMVRRAAAAADLAASGLLDPATSLVLADAAYAAQSAEPEVRESAESDLTRALDVVFGDAAATRELRANPAADALLDELAVACRRVAMARTLYNDTVRSTVRVRRSLAVRWLRLAGTAAMPEAVEFDDRVPAGLRS